MEDENNLIAFGDSIKATVLDGGGVHLGGYLIKFSDETNPDLTGDFFTKNTDFGSAEDSLTWFNHRLPVKLQKVNKKVSYLERLQNAKLTRDEVGIFAEVVIEARNEYEKTIAELGKLGKLSWSSGTAPHLVDRKSYKNGAFEILSWPLGTDASFTPTPAEYSNTNNLVTLKSLISPDAALPDKDESKNNLTNGDQTNMNDEIKSAIDAALAERDAKVKAEADSQAAIKAAEEAAYRKGVEDAQVKAPAFNTKTVLGFSEEKDAVPAFKHWVQTGQINQALITPDSSYMNIKAAMAIGAGATGGYLVPDPLYAQIIAKRDIASWVRQAPTQKFTTPADHLLVPTEDTSMTAFVSTNEAAAYNENEPTIAQVDMVLTKYTKIIKASEEFVNNEATNFDTWLVDALGRAEAATENTVASAVLVSGATSSGITTASATAITIPELGATAGSLGGGYEVNGSTGWLMKNASLWYLKGVFGTNYYAFDGLFNKPAWVSDDLDAIAASKKPVFYGNWNLFGVVEKPGMLVQRNPYLYMANGQIGIFANIFRGFAVLQSEALVYLNTHA